MIKRLTIWHCRPGHDPDDAMRRWTGSHVALVTAVPGVRRYVQNRCVPGPSGADIPYAGLGELWFDSVDAAAVALESNEWRAVLDDAFTFMDPDRITAAWAEASPDHSSGSSKR